MKKMKYSAIFCSLGVCLLLHGMWGNGLAEVGFQDVRFARCDVDGDGIAEIVVGGRLGPVLPVDAPWSMREAGVGVFRPTGNLLTSLGVRNDLKVVMDVAAGDLDGDGHDEIMTVGMGKLVVLGFREGELKPQMVMDLPSFWTDRVVMGDVDGDGRAEVGVTCYAIDDRAEVGQTTIVFYRWQSKALVAFHQLFVDRHVGDLCVIKKRDGDLDLVIEVGTGDEGGEARRYSLRDWSERGAGVVTDQGMRALSLDALNNTLIVGSVDGTVRFFDGTSAPWLLIGQQTQTAGLSGLVGVASALWLGGNRQGVYAHALGF